METHGPVNFSHRDVKINLYIKGRKERERERARGGGWREKDKERERDV
jgi:hypothetical protein